MSQLVTELSFSRQTVNAELIDTGYSVTTKITDTLQGEIWRAVQVSSNDICVVKATVKKLHKQRVGVVADQPQAVQEDILKEASILKYLSSCKRCPSPMIEYHGIYQSKSAYYLIEQYGGNALFPFVVNAHHFIETHTLDITNWLEVVRVIFGQLIDAIDFMHSQRICHFDISLENMTLFNDLMISIENEHSAEEKIEFVNVEKSVKVKIIDFGLAERFDENATTFESSKYCGKSNYQCPEIVKRQSSFDAAANDVWCAGVCLFMLVAGCPPFKVAHDSDEAYRCIMHGQIRGVLKHWKRLKYFDGSLLDLLSSIFKPEAMRVSVAKIKCHAWYRLNEKGIEIN